MPSDSLSSDPLNAQPSLSARRQGEVQLVAQVCGWIDLHLDEEISWERLVRISGQSAANLQVLFLRHVKTTPMMYIRGRRNAPIKGASAVPVLAPTAITRLPGDAAPDL